MNFISMQKDIFANNQYMAGHELELVASGEPFFNHVLRIIENARRGIHFQMYIFDEDRTGKEVAAALMSARERGVEVFMTLDSYGSKSLSPDFIANLQRSGIQFKSFSPLPEHFYIFRLGRRLHNKVIVADDSEALIGGINIADKYRGNEVETAWLDYAIRVKGPVCVELSRICERIFREKYFGKIMTAKKVVPGPNAGDAHSRLAVNDWFRRKNQIGAGYKAAINKSRSTVAIMASYFLPGRSLRTALKNAARRGVQVRVLLPGKSDLAMAKRATRYLYCWLLKNNIVIYEWEKSILHGKLAVIDSKWVTIGSYNLNHLSEYSSIEMNVEVLDEHFAATVHQTLLGLMQQSTKITTDTFAMKRRAFDRFLDWGAYLFARWIMLFLFFLVKRDHKYKDAE